MQAFIDFLAQITELTPGFVQEVTQYLNRERYKAKQIIQGEGQTENRVWYLKSGLARNYIYDEQGQQHTLRFWKAGEVIFSYAGFLRDPSRTYTELLADSELFSCSYHNLEKILHDHPEAGTIIAFFNRRYLQKEYQRDRLHAMKSKERYQFYRKENPEVFSVAPLWMIASYLHMSRENLSRIISEE